MVVGVPLEGEKFKETVKELKNDYLMVVVGELSIGARRARGREEKWGVSLNGIGHRYMWGLLRKRT